MKLLFNENKNLVVEKNNDIVEFKKDEIDFQLPDDFQIYVLDAQKGNYYNEEFPSRWIELTGEWKHGYSKGYAYSTKRNIIIYWAEIW